MENFKLFITALHKCFTNSEDNNPPIRMSDIAHTSISYVSLHNSTLKSNNENEMNKSVKNHEDKIVYSIINNLKSDCETHSEQTLMKVNNTQLEGNKFDENENRVPSLRIAIPTMDENTPIHVVNDLSKIKYPIVEQNSTEFVFTPDKDVIHNPSQNQVSIEENTVEYKQKVIIPITNNKQKQMRPIMGKSALFKKANIDANDSLIIHDIILDKYNPVLNHYINRMYRRRKSRVSSSEDEYNSDTVFSSPPNYSPISVSSVGSSGFTFPSIHGEEQDQLSPYSLYPTDNRKSCSVVGRRTSFKKAFSFLASTDDVNAETSVEDMENFSMVSTGTVYGETSYSDYDPEKFLKVALGDLTTQSEITNGNAGRHIRDKINHTNESTVGSTDLSSLVSKANSFYSSVKNNFKKRRSNVRTSYQCDVPSNNQNPTTGNPHLEILRRELAIQNEIIFQISKALIYCRDSKEFTYSMEHVEAEKILMVASITKEALINEVNTIEFNNYQNASDPRNRGEVEISNIVFHPNEKCDDINQNPDCRVYFLVVATCGRKVIASSVMETDEKSFLNVDKHFHFPDLAADFEICLFIYSMMVHIKEDINQDQHFSCPSPKTIFHLNKNSKKYKVVNDVPCIKSSAFNLLGKCYIRNSEPSKTDQKGSIILKLHDVPIYSKISPNFSAKINNRIHLQVKINGFLTIGIENDHSCTMWNRRWCVLNGSELKYWNYPSEEVNPPLGFVELSYCVVQQIMLVDRSACARPRTLMLPVKNGDTIKKYLLCADNSTDMEMWEKELNFVVRSLMTWKCLKYNKFSCC